MEEYREYKTLMLILTENCNLNCVYCYEHHKTLDDMPFETAKRAIDAEFHDLDRYEHGEIELFGGEPFLNFALIKRIYDYVMDTYGKDNDIVFSTTTNGTLVHGKIQDWLRERKDKFIVTLSLDGTPEIHNKNRPEMKKKQKYKHYIFEKIVNWFNLFDDYISHIRDNTSLGDDKSIIEDFSHSINSSNSDLDSGSQSVFLFRVNVQREEYLKGKLALRCKNLSDALFYFIRAAKKKSIVSDGLIKKKSLKRIHKIVIKLIKKYQYYGIIKWEMKEKVHEYERQKQRSNYKR